MKGLGKMDNEIMFNQRIPSLLVVDNFYKDPDFIVEETKKFEKKVEIFKIFADKKQNSLNDLR